MTLLNPYLGLAQDAIPLPICAVCRGTGRNPDSDVANWLPCGQCRGTGENAWRPNVAPNDPRTVLNLDPTRFLCDGDAVTEHRPRYRVIPATDPRLTDAEVEAWHMGALMDAATEGYDADMDLDIHGRIA